MCVCVRSSQWKTGEYVSSLMCWNSSQVWSEGFGNRMGGGRGSWGGVSLDRNDRLVEASLTQEAPVLNTSRIRLAISTGSTFHILSPGRFLWSKTASTTPAHHSSLDSFFFFFLSLKGGNSVEMQVGPCNSHFLLIQLASCFSASAICFRPLSETTLKARLWGPWSRETTSVADISSFLSKWKGGGGEVGVWLRWTLNPVDCLHKAFPCWLSCMCEGPFFPPPVRCCLTLCMVSACVEQLPLALSD